MSSDAATQREWRRRNPGKAAEYSRDYRLRLKLEVINAYGGSCACCGETEIAFLGIDHLNNDGAEHRKQVGVGTGVRNDLKGRGYPEGYQVLCHNCNLGRQINGGTCPHQTALREAM